MGAIIAVTVAMSPIRQASAVDTDVFSPLANQNQCGQVTGFQGYFDSGGNKWPERQYLAQSRQRAQELAAKRRRDRKELENQNLDSQSESEIGDALITELFTSDNQLMKLANNVYVDPNAAECYERMKKRLNSDIHPRDINGSTVYLDNNRYYMKDTGYLRGVLKYNPKTGKSEFMAISY
uniref:Uncharacterized protein n=1 Tax=Amicula sp. isolate GU52X-4 cfCalB7 TaxID=3003489 RepID=A0A9E8Z6U4_9STRA|nr:hypothetical protein [Amicula sp. isolate GU52X-4 cfCalB7]